MDAKCQQLVDAYLRWLKDKISVADVGGICEITTPFLDRHNDRLQIYVRHEGDKLLLTDDGYILGDLESSGCSFESTHRKETLRVVLNGYGVNEQNGELVTEANADTFPRRKHALIQAMLTVHDIFMTVHHKPSTIFIEEVHRFLEQHEVRFTPRVDFAGKSGFTHKFDFVIPRSRKKPGKKWCQFIFPPASSAARGAGMSAASPIERPSRPSSARCRTAGRS